MPAGLLKIREAAEDLHFSETSVRRLIKAGELETIRVGPRSVRIWAKSVERLLSRGYGDENDSYGDAA